MLYIILSIIILVAVYFIASKFCYDDDAMAFVTLFVFLLGFVPVINMFWGLEEYTEEVRVYDITGLELQTYESTYINGRFILGCGYINGSSSSGMKYVFFSNEEYGKQLKNISIKNTYLKETDDEVPCLKEIRKYRKRKTNIIDWLWNNKEEYVIWNYTVDKIILVVPTNTIKIDYNVEI